MKSTFKVISRRLRENYEKYCKRSKQYGATSVCDLHAGLLGQVEIQL